MDEHEIHAAYERLSAGATPPPGVRQHVAARVARRRRRRTTSAVLAAVLVVGGTAGAAAALRGGPVGEIDPVAEPAPAQTPGPMTCASGRYSAWSPGFLVAWPVYADPTDVAGAFLRPGERTVTVRTAKQADVHVERPDGTTRAVLTLPRVDGGWTWEAEASVCSDDGPDADLAGATRPDQVTCPREVPQVVSARIVNPDVGAGSTEPDDLGQGWRGELDWEIADAGEVDDSGRRLVTVRDPRGRVRASLEVVELDGVWRVSALAACPTDVPGLPRRRGADLVAVHVGHCWVDTLTYDGRAWEVRDADQFGWGGGQPDGFRSVGTASVTGDLLTYTDASGTRLQLVPADTPGTEANQGLCS